MFLVLKKQLPEGLLGRRRDYTMGGLIWDSLKWRMLNKIAAYGLIGLMMYCFLLSTLVLEPGRPRVNQKAGNDADLRNEV